MATASHYALLGLARTCSTDEVRAAYKARAMKSHPDRGGDPAVWQRVQLAFDTLADPEKRAVYDRSEQDTEGGAETRLVQQFGAGAFDLSAGGESRTRKGGMSISAQLAAVAKDEERMRENARTSVIEHAGQMSHSAGFDAWIRNQQGLGRHGAFTAEDLLRSAPGGVGGGIEATESTTTPLPPLTATAICFDAHGPPEEVLRIDAELALPRKLRHGEVLEPSTTRYPQHAIHNTLSTTRYPQHAILAIRTLSARHPCYPQVLVQMLAACVNDDDVFRVQTPLTILNQFPPFSRASNKWRPVALPAIAGGEGVGVVVAAAKDVGPADGAGRGLPGLTPKEAEEALEVRDWVVALPDSRGAPLGCWGSLRIYDSARLLKVAPQQLPLQHYACSRSLCTAYRLLEDYGDLRPGDTLIQNGADLPTGQVVIQLCKLLKIRTINLVQDDEGFPRTKEVLDRLGATHVLRDNAKLGEFLGAIGADMPRLALDAHGGDAGRRLAVALRPGGSLVVHSLSSGAAPQLSPSVLLYHQVSLHAFSLAHWTAQPQNGRAGYARMLRSLGDLARAEKLHLFTRAVPVAGLDASKLREALGSHRAVQSGATFRERSVFVFGDEASARDLSFELAEQIRQLEAEETAGDDGLPGGGVVVGAGAREAQMAASGGGAGGGGRGGGGGGGSLARWADAQAMLRELGMEAYVPLFEEEEMTGMQLLRDIAARADGDKELMEAFKEMGIKKMGHRQTIVNAVLGLLP